MKRLLYFVPIVLYLSLATIILTGATFNKPQQKSGWTIETLKEYYDERFDALELAITKAEEAYKEKFANTNEWRGSYEDLLQEMQKLIQSMQRDYISRTEFVTMEKQMTELKERVSKLETLKIGGSNTLYVIIAIVGLLTAVLALSRNFISSIYKQNNEPRPKN